MTDPVKTPAQFFANRPYVKWHLVQIRCWDAPYWLKSEGDYWHNTCGGRTPKSADDQVFETVDGDYEDLDHLKTGLMVKKSTSGWLDREARFHPCRFYEHDLYVRLILKREVAELERAGWVRVHGKGAWGCLKQPSTEQLNWLNFRGYDLCGWDF